MSNELAKLKVTLEAQTSAYKKEMKEAREVTKQVSDSIKSETSKITANANMDKAAESVKKQMSLIQKMKQTMSGKLPEMPESIKKSLRNTRSGAPFSAMLHDVRQYVKEAQLAAGIKVHTEEYQQNERDIERVTQALERLKQKKRDLLNGNGPGRSEALENVNGQIQAAEKQLEKYQAHGRYMQFRNTDTERPYTGRLSDGNSFQTAGAVMRQTASRIREMKEAAAEALKRIPVLGRALSNAAAIGSKGWGGLKKLISAGNQSDK